MKPLLLLLLASSISSSLLAAPPTCVAGPSIYLFKMGKSNQLDGSGSTGATSYYWTQLKGNSVLRWSSRSVVNPLVREAVPGNYQLQLKVSNVDGSTTCTIGATTIDDPQIASYTVKRSFKLSKVPGATQVRCTLIKADATLVTDTTSTSPCSLTDTSPNSQKLIRMEYLNAGGTVLASQQAYTKRTYWNAWFPYATEGATYQRKLEIAQWSASKFNIPVSGFALDAREYDPFVRYSTYINYSYIYSPQAIDVVKAFTDAHGYTDHEKMFVHSKVDLTPAHPYDISMRKFDHYDSGGCYGPTCGDPALKNGILEYNGSAFTDKSPTVGNFTWSQNTYYIGYSEPFDEINYNVTTPANGITVTYAYSTGAGSFTSFSPSGDCGITITGTCSWNPPANWVTASVNSSRAKYWIRVSLTSGGTRPITASVLGFDWTGTGQRGYDWTSPTRINVGTPLEYDPTPPPGSTAKFKYRSRLCGIWANNIHIFDHSYMVNGIYPTTQMFLEQFDAQFAIGKYDSLFFDDFGSGQQTSDANMDLDPPYTSYGTATLDSFLQFSNNYHTKYPGALVAPNTGSGTSFACALGADFALMEYFTTPIGGTGLFHPVTTLGNRYDNFLTTAQGGYCDNPPAYKLIAQVRDYTSLVPYKDVFFDRGNRGPILMLAHHYMGRNEHIGFDYNPYTASYFNLDEVYHVDRTVHTTTTANVVIGTNSVSVASTAGFAKDTAPPTMASNLYYIRVGTESDYILLGCSGTSGGNTFTGCSNGDFFEGGANIRRAYTSPVDVYQIKTTRRAVNPDPPMADVVSWGVYFPAMSVDIGEPIAAREFGEDYTQFVIGNNITQHIPTTDCDYAGHPWNRCGDLDRRKYENAVVLMRFFDKDTAILLEEHDIPSKAVCIDTGAVAPAACTGATYYPLRADGTTGPGTNTVSLRTSEGAIMMRYPIP